MTILKLGGEGAASFPVFTTSHVEIKYQLADDSTVVFDGYIETSQKLSSSAETIVVDS